MSGAEPLLLPPFQPDRRDVETSSPGYNTVEDFTGFDEETGV